MVDQNTFMETIGAVSEIIRTSDVPLSEQEILSYFADMELDETQKKIVLEYLKDPKNGNTLEEEDSVQTEDEDRAAEPDEAGEEREDSESDGMQGERPRSAVLQMYMDELSYLPTYSKEEEEQMYKALLGGDSDMIRMLSDAWLKRVLVIADKYMAPKIHVEDLIQEGNMALFLKLQELCGFSQKVDVEEELKSAIEEGIMAFASDVSGEQQLENMIVGKVNLVHEAKKMLTGENGNAPTVEELSEYTKMPVKELQDILDIIADSENKD